MPFVEITFTSEVAGYISHVLSTYLESLLEDFAHGTLGKVTRIPKKSVC